jgi:PPOX class probable F420-dependent enzyme
MTEASVVDIGPFTALVPADGGLAVLGIALPDGSVHSSVANVGVLAHPLTRAPVVGVVVAGGARKLRHLRAHPRATATLRAGWRWAAVDGPVEIGGPDDPLPGIDAERLRLLLREIFRAAGGAHDDWDSYDRVMAAERRAAVLITPERLYGNRPRRADLPDGAVAL